MRTTRVGRELPYWLALLPAALLLIALLPPFVDLVGYWIDNEAYHHGFLIAAVSVAWTGKTVANMIAGREPDLRVLLPLACALSLTYVFWQGNSPLGTYLLLPISIWLCFAVTLGTRNAIALIGPVGYLYFAIPLWDLLLPYLQQITIFGAKSSMELAGIPVIVSGAQVIIAEGTFEVVYGCSGLRYLLVATALAVLMGLVDGMRWSRLAVLLVVTAALAVLANWLRVFVVMYAGHVTKMSHYFVTDSHQGIGNVIFAFLLAGIFLAMRQLNKGARTGGRPVESAARAGVLQADSRNKERTACVATFAIVGIFGVLVARALWIPAAAASPQLQPLPMASDWQGPLPGNPLWSPRFVDAQQTSRADYRKVTPAGTAIQLGVYINVYGVQQHDKKLVNYKNSLLGPGKWQFLSSRPSAAAPALGHRLAVDEYLTDRGERWIVGYSYRVAGHNTVWAVGAQLLYGLSTLTNPAPAGVIAIAAPCERDCEAAYESVSQFWQEMADPILQSIPVQMTVVSEH